MSTDSVEILSPWMEKTDCFGLEWVPSVDGAPSIEAKNQITETSKSCYKNKILSKHSKC